MNKKLTLLTMLLIGIMTATVAQASPGTFLLQLLGIADTEVTVMHSGGNNTGDGEPPGWADVGLDGEPPGWSQNNPGAGGSDGPAEGPFGP